MNILIVYNSGLLDNGSNDCLIEKAIGEFALELKKNENNVSFFGQIVNSYHEDVRVFPILENKLGLYALKRKKNKYLSYIVLYIYSFYALLKSDFIYIFYPNAFKYLALFAKLTNKKYGLYIRGCEDLEDKTSKIIYKHAKIILTVSPNLTDIIRSMTTTSFVETIRPMIPFSLNDISTNREYSNKKKYKLLYIGRIVDDKGLDELINAIAEFKTSQISIHLTVVGTGDYHPHIKYLITKLNIQDMVTFVGGIHETDKIKMHYLDSDLFILPSYHEGFPRTIYESMIFGLPVITTFVGGIPAIMKDGFNCKKIKTNSVDSIVEILKYACYNYEVMGNYARNGIITVKNILISRNLSHADQLNDHIKNTK